MGSLCKKEDNYGAYWLDSNNGASGEYDVMRKVILLLGIVITIIGIGIAYNALTNELHDNYMFLGGFFFSLGTLLWSISSCLRDGKMKGSLVLTSGMLIMSISTFFMGSDIGQAMMFVGMIPTFIGLIWSLHEDRTITIKI